MSAFLAFALCSLKSATWHLKLVATFAVMMVVVLSAYIVYQQSFIRRNRENVADLLHRLNVLQRSIDSTKKQQCGASNSIDVGLVEN